jgi:hypothetical protein
LRLKAELGRLIRAAPEDPLLCQAAFTQENQLATKWKLSLARMLQLPGTSKVLFLICD